MFYQSTHSKLFPSHEVMFKLCWLSPQHQNMFYQSQNTPRSSHCMKPCLSYVSSPHSIKTFPQSKHSKLSRSIKTCSFKVTHTFSAAAKRSRVEQSTAFPSLWEQVHPQYSSCDMQGNIVNHPQSRSSTWLSPLHRNMISLDQCLCTKQPGNTSLQLSSLLRNLLSPDQMYPHKVGTYKSL